MAWNKKISTLFKAIVVLLSVTYIAIKIYKQISLTNYQANLFQINTSLWWLIIVLLVFTCLNWLIESLKWQFLIKKLQALSLSNSIKAILSGITVSIITPNRIGEFGGRILALERRNRVQGVFATFLGGYSQLLITLCTGLIALPIYLSKFPEQITLNINENLIFFISVVVICLCLFVYFKIELFAKIIESFIKQEKKKRFVGFLKEYKKNELLKILMFSFIRYVIFTSQFFLILKLFNVQIAYSDAITGISVIYFLLAITPVVSLFEFSVRGSIAVLVLGVYSPLTISIISASVLLWLINIALPAIIGSVTLFKLKI